MILTDKLSTALEIKRRQPMMSVCSSLIFYNMRAKISHDVRHLIICACIKKKDGLQNVAKAHHSLNRTVEIVPPPYSFGKVQDD